MSQRALSEQFSILNLQFQIFNSKFPILNFKVYNLRSVWAKNFWHRRQFDSLGIVRNCLGSFGILRDHSELLRSLGSLGSLGSLEIFQNPSESLEITRNPSESNSQTRRQTRTFVCKVYELDAESSEFGKRILWQSTLTCDLNKFGYESCA